MSEVAEVFATLPKLFQKQKVKAARSYYFSLDDEEKWMVKLSPQGCTVAQGKSDDADCFFKASTQMFLDVWDGKYTPSAMDFMMGKIKSNNPMLLKDFIEAFKQ